MRYFSFALTAALALSGALAGCRSASPPSSSALLPPSTFAPNTELLLKILAVTDSWTGGVVLINDKGKKFGDITYGLGSPDGASYDSKGDLYVADPDNGQVQEYAPNATKPTFTYSHGLVAPVDVTTDSKFNVIVGDYAGATITEFKQKSNKIEVQCSPGGNVQGVAYDVVHRTFFATTVETTSLPGKIVEYKDGLTGCQDTALKPKLGFPGGIAVDPKENLIACDQTPPAVYIIKPPYDKIDVTLKGLRVPFRPALNPKGNELFITDYAAKDVRVFFYPSLKRDTTLGSSSGLAAPQGVAMR